VKKREGSVRVYRIADNEEKKKNTVRVHRCKEEEDRHGSNECWLTREEGHGCNECHTRRIRL